MKIFKNCIKQYLNAKNCIQKQLTTFIVVHRSNTYIYNI